MTVGPYVIWAKDHNTPHTQFIGKSGEGGLRGGGVRGVKALKCQNFEKKEQYEDGWEINPITLQWGNGIYISLQITSLV